MTEKRHILAMISWLAPIGWLAMSTMALTGWARSATGPGTARKPGGKLFSVRVVMMLALSMGAVLMAQSMPAWALDAILLKRDADRVELTTLGQYFSNTGDRLQVDTAPGRNGLSARIVVSAAAPGSNPSWMVFALTNPTTKSLERWLVASRYTLVGSGAIWPKLDAPRIEAITPSLGVIPERVKNDQKDIFSITVPPGRTVTYVVELASAEPTRIYLWKPLAFTEKSRDRQLFNGIMLGIVGLLGIFLVAVFVANHKIIFPSAALVAWCVLAYLCVEFGFWHKLFQLRAEDNAVYRAMAEASVAASLVIFLFAFLRLSVWHGFIRMVFGVWMLAQLGLVFAGVIDPQLASTFARLSFVVIGSVGGLLALFLAARGQDRALALIPTWLLFGVWIFGMAMAMSGRLSGDVAVSALTAGLVLLTLLIGFTVTQFAFRSGGQNYGAAPNQLELRSLAIDGAGATVWEWSERRDEVKVSPVVEMILGLNAGELSTKVDSFVKHLHPADKERLRLTLFSAKESSVEDIHIDFRMRHADNSYRWFELVAASVPGVDRQSLRCVGLMRDITDSKRAQERLTHDAVHDSLTGLPNRELFIDRLGVATRRFEAEGTVRPTVLFIDIDKFKSINSSFGLIVGDSLLLTIARKLGRHIGPQDTLARVGGDQFALLVMRQTTPTELGKLADGIRQALRAPIPIAGQEIILTVSIGLAVSDGQSDGDSDLLREAEIAMYRAKGAGTDRIELFEPAMRKEKDERITIESDLRRALDQNQLKLLYQPIMQLNNEELVGFEALVRWEHPKLGLLNPADFVPVAEETDLIVKLGSYVLRAAAQEAARWHVELPRPDNPLFVSVNVSSRQLFRQDLIQEMRHIIGQEIVPRGSLRLEVTESLVMENPEQALQMLELLKNAGAELSMDDFGTGYSSLAYLQRFPFDTIKVDRALVQGSGEEGAEAVIIRSIVALAHELDMKVIAEGVEILEDVTYLRSIGCGFAQGFFYGQPMSEREVRKMLRIIQQSEHQKRRSSLFRSKSKVKKKPEAELSAAVPRRVPGDAPPNSPSTRAADLMSSVKAKVQGAPAKSGTSPKSAQNGQRPPPTVRDGQAPGARAANVQRASAQSSSGPASSGQVSSMPASASQDSGSRSSSGQGAERPSAFAGQAANAQNSQGHQGQQNSQGHQGRPGSVTTSPDTAASSQDRPQGGAGNRKLQPNEIGNTAHQAAAAGAAPPKSPPRPAMSSAGRPAGNGPGAPAPSSAAASASPRRSQTPAPAGASAASGQPQRASNSAERSPREQTGNVKSTASAPQNATRQNQNQNQNPATPSRAMPARSEVGATGAPARSSTGSAPATAPPTPPANGRAMPVAPSAPGDANAGLSNGALTDYPTLPPAIAASLARLAGVSVDPAKSATAPAKAANKPQIGGSLVEAAAKAGEKVAAEAGPGRAPPLEARQPAARQPAALKPAAAKPAAPKSAPPNPVTPKPVPPNKARQDR